MTKDQLAGRLVVGIGGTALSATESAWLDRYRPAGVILFGRNVADIPQLKRLCGAIHSLLGVDAEIVADHEGGPISVLAAALGRPPAPWTLGRIDDTALTRAVHRATGQRLREAGVDRLLGPCCDVLVERRNPVIGARSFGGYAEQVARHSAAAVAGLSSAGVRCCLKHWPGHGGSLVDSHDDAVATATAEIAAPFHAGWQAGADALMVGHLPWTPVQAPDRRGGAASAPLPATLDPAALAAARASAPAGALLYADDVTMGALRAAMQQRGIVAGDRHGSGLVDPAALSPAWLTALLEAGCDRLLVRGIPWAACPLGDGPSAALDDAPAARSDGVAAGQPEVYRQVRERALPRGWGWEPGEPLLWLDATAGDRWGAASGLEPWLARRFGPPLKVTVATTNAGPTGAPQTTTEESDRRPAVAARPWRNLLVTSHRPLAIDGFAATVAASGCASRGACLVMGHPSLAEDVAAPLGSGWLIGALYDIAAADLAPALTDRR